MSKSQRLTKREYFLLWKLLDHLIQNDYKFDSEGRLERDYKEIRDKCLDKGFDYKP